MEPPPLAELQAHPPRRPGSYEPSMSLRRRGRVQRGFGRCHNLCCVIQEWYELGIDPTDWGMPARKRDETPAAIPRFPD